MYRMVYKSGADSQAVTKVGCWQLFLTTNHITSSKLCCRSDMYCSVFSCLYTGRFNEFTPGKPEWTPRCGVCTLEAWCKSSGNNQGGLLSMFSTIVCGTLLTCPMINICDRICEKGPYLAKLTFPVCSFVAGHVDLGRSSDFLLIGSMMPYLAGSQVSQRGEGCQWSYDSNKVVGQARAANR